MFIGLPTASQATTLAAPPGTDGMGSPQKRVHPTEVALE